jgi:hypothetical protein
MSSMPKQSMTGLESDHVRKNIPLPAPEGLEQSDESSIRGAFVKLDGKRFYRIANYDLMRPFLMTIISPNDQWMYVSSRGGLTAGRVSAENCLFPYDSADKLHHCHSYTGPLTLIKQVNPGGARQLWQPFSYHLFENGSSQRNLYKHVVGDQVVFEEINERLGLAFRYRWRTSNQFGFIRSVTLENIGTSRCEVDMLDGLQNLQPYGIELSTYQKINCLADAYKQSQCDLATKLGVFSLTSQIIDHPVAAEVLKATTIACVGLDEYNVLLSTDQFRDFCFGDKKGVQSEQFTKGQRGHYFVCTEFSLAPGESRSWHLAADVARDHSQIARLRTLLADDIAIEFELKESIERDHHNLVRNVASSDGLQRTGCQLATTHHFANALFNNMRGGVFAANYQVETVDFERFMEVRNRETYHHEQSFLSELPTLIDHDKLLDRIRAQENRDLLRLGLEYLPLIFSRRHGDPSRPWNHFHIHIQNADGSRDYHYEGNWRDIFQNWEALGHSFPHFLPSMIAKFVNASTVDGHNPYRVLRNGIEWEIPMPNNPWSNIGYWGDHQIVYLVKLLEAARQHFPGLLEDQLEEEIFVYADVPYRIEAYEKLIANCRETIHYDVARAEEIDLRVKTFGEDGKLVQTKEGGIQYVCLVEKLLVPALAKLSNLVLDGGIWMNTQRPEWNDANNALVGPGLSVVTACYLRRYLDVLMELLERTKNAQVAISVEVVQWLRSLRTVYLKSRHLLQQPSVSDGDRRCLLDELGQTFSDYRLKVYDYGFSGKQNFEVQQIMALLNDAKDYLDYTVSTNRRSDGLYHAYNLLQLCDEPHTASLSHLYEMLEGQVAVLSTGRLGPDEAVQVVNKMFGSPLYRSDQQSFLLYPERELPGFLNRNIIPKARIQSIELLRKLVERGEVSLAVKSERGEHHFDSNILNLRNLNEQLEELSKDPRWTRLVEQDTAEVRELFDEVFQHSQYTGRSGAMFGYEGLGSIYWHMVSKLLLAVQEVFFRAVDEDASQELIQALGKAYYRIRGGLSSDKTPQEYGAFPTDPYSHTPKHSGAQQPGMTGQVKEEILTRKGELGIRVLNGQVCFEPRLLRKSEFMDRPVDFLYYDVHGQAQSQPLREASLAFTICQTLVIYYLSTAGVSVDVRYYEGEHATDCQDRLNVDTSRKLFSRTGELSRIEVQVPLAMLFEE